RISYALERGRRWRHSRARGALGGLRVNTARQSCANLVTPCARVRETHGRIPAETHEPLFSGHVVLEPPAARLRLNQQVKAATVKVLAGGVRRRNGGRRQLLNQAPHGGKFDSGLLLRGNLPPKLPPRQGKRAGVELRPDSGLPGELWPARVC